MDFEQMRDNLCMQVVISGTIFLVLDTEEVETKHKYPPDPDTLQVELKAGDTFVQRGTQHAWSNRWWTGWLCLTSSRSSLPCRVAFVITDAKFDAGLRNKFATS